MLAVCWLTTASGGLWILLAYENRPGTAAEAPAQWPAQSRLARATDRPTLVMLAHPQCTCSQASVGELAEVLARVALRPRTYILFLKPAGFADGWEQSDLWKSAQALPDVTLVTDSKGTEAGKFGAATSGQTVLYDRTGTLLFSGGITGARAHPGDNAGRATLLDSLTRGSVAQTRTSVFGCPLFEDR